MAKGKRRRDEAVIREEKKRELAREIHAGKKLSKYAAKKQRQLGGAP